MVRISFLSEYMSTEDHLKHINDLYDKRHKISVPAKHVSVTRDCLYFFRYELSKLYLYSCVSLSVCVRYVFLALSLLRVSRVRIYHPFSRTFVVFFSPRFANWNVTQLLIG